MVHYLVCMKSQRKYLDEMETFILNRRYITTFPDIPGMQYQPNLREIRFYDISVFESCKPQLLKDLAPYGSLSRKFPKFLRMGINFVMKKLGFDEPPPGIHEFGFNQVPQWRTFIDVEILASKKDQKIKVDNDFPFKVEMI